MDKKYYDVLKVSENATDAEITEKYNELKMKYSEERFADGEKGNNAAKMLNKIEVAYTEIMNYRREHGEEKDEASALAEVEKLIRDNDLAGAQTALDKFDSRSAEWHYLQSVVFYKKNWISESKKQLEIAMQLEPNNQKYKDVYDKFVTKINFDNQSKQNQNAYTSGTTGGGTNGNPNANPNGQPQMGGSGCEDCLTCCYCNMLFNCCLNTCCGCR